MSNFVSVYTKQNSYKNKLNKQKHPWTFYIKLATCNKYA